MDAPTVHIRLPVSRQDIHVRPTKACLHRMTLHPSSELEPAITRPRACPSRPLRNMPHIQLLAGFGFGMVAGSLTGLFAPASHLTIALLRFVVRPIEQLFLSSLFLLIVPLLCSAIISGVARLRNETTVRRLLLTTLAYMAVLSALGAIIGMAMANLFRPGDAVPPDIGQHLLNTHLPSATTGVVGMVLSGHILEGPIWLLVILSLLLGTILTLFRSRHSRRLLDGAEGLYGLGMQMVGIVTRFAPIAVGCFIFELTVVFGWHLLLYLGAYVVVVVAALLLQMGLTFSGVVWMRGDMSPPQFFRRTQEAALIAFTTTSSNATLPAALQVAENDLGLPARIARLVLGVGTISNQSGTAIYTAVTVLFVGQFFGMDLTLSNQAIVFLVSALAGMGTIGVPAGSLPTVATVLALTGLPPEGIGLVVGVDRLVDMFRTVVNVVGDLAIAVALSHDETERHAPSFAETEPVGIGLPKPGASREAERS